MLRSVLAVAAVLAALVGVGCSDDAKESPTATTAAASSPTPASTNAPVIIGQVADAVSSGDPARLLALVEFQKIPCTAVFVPGAGGPPMCRDGEADATPVEVVMSATCEGAYVRKDELSTTTVMTNAVGTNNKVWAAYEYSDAIFGPGAKYFIVFQRAEPLSNGTGYGIITTPTGVLGVHYGCGWSPADFSQFNKFGPAVISPKP